jgi:hypothetical protein
MGLIARVAAIAAAASFAIGCTTQDNCPLCGTDKNGPVTTLTAMQVPQSSPFGKPFAAWDIVLHDPATRRLYVTDRSHAAIAVYDTVQDAPLGQVGPGMFVGSVCCNSDRATNFNQLSGPNAVIVTPPPAGGTLGLLWVSDGDSTLKVYDLDTDTLPVAHNDGAATQSFGTVHTGITFTDLEGCIRGTTFNNPNSCGDLRADEMAWDPEHRIVLVSNGDAAVPFVTLVDANNPACAGNSCVKAQFFFDGKGDNLTTGCPAPSASGVVTGGVLCRHGPLATNGIGGSVYDPATHRFLISTPQVGPNPADGEVTELDPVAMRVTNHFSLAGAGCQVAFLALGPINNLLVGCANREGEAFFPSTIVMDATRGNILKTIFDVGRVDEVWYNDGDKRFYLAARDMNNGSVLGVIDALTNTWMQNAPTGGNAHGVAADPFNNHIYVPLGVNARCGRFNAEGCVAVYVAQ